MAKFRILQAAAMLLIGWIAGVMTGGWLGGESSRTTSGDSDTGGSRVERDAGKRGGVVLDSTDEAESRAPWTAARIQTAMKSLTQEGDIIGFHRRTVQLMDLFGKADFPAAFDSIALLATDKRTKATLEQFAIARWAQLDPAAAFPYLAAKDKFGGDPDLNALAFFSAWGSVAPEAAAVFANGLNNIDRKNEGLAAVVVVLAKKNAEEALAFAKSHAPELMNSGFEDILLKRHFNYTSLGERAQQLVATFGSDSKGNQIDINDAAFDWSKTDRSAAMTWARSLEGPNARKAALSGVYREWFETAPKEAAAVLFSEQTDALDFHNAGIFGVNAWPEEEIAGAISWVEKLPTEHARIGAFGALGGRLGFHDRDAGVKWLSSLAPSPERDEAIEEYVKVSPLANAGGIEWTLTMTNPAQRNRAARTVFGNWFRQNPTEAAQWLQTDQSIPAAQKVELFRK